MKKTLLLILLCTAIGSGAVKVQSCWEESLVKAATSAVTAEKGKHKRHINTLNDNHKNEVKRLKRKHKKDVAKVKSKERAKAKVQRAVSAVPIMGIAVFGIFEKIEFDSWKLENPDGTFEEYSIEIGSEVNELLSSEYQEYREEYMELLSMWNKYAEE